MTIIPLRFQAQETEQHSFYGISAGLSFSFGTHVNRLGLSVGGYGTYHFAQANAGFRAYYNFQSLGLKQKGLELQMNAGFQLGFGRKQTDRNPFIGAGENNLLQDYSIGYDYFIYLDRQKTSQTTGMLSVTALDFKFATENDLFGFGQGWRDRYRTGAFLFEYRYDRFKFGIQSTMWTDDYSICKKVLDTDYPARFGYKNDERCKFGGASNGILAIRANWLVPDQYVPLNQNVQMEVGIDAQQIRNLIQNKMIHDHYPIPEKLIKRNPCHYPMRSKDGSQFLYEDGQQIEKAKFYYNLGLNQALFY